MTNICTRKFSLGVGPLKRHVNGSERRLDLFCRQFELGRIIARGRHWYPHARGAIARRSSF